MLRQHSRFPVVSGFRVSWDSRKPPGERILGIWLVSDTSDTSGSLSSTPVHSGTSTPAAASVTSLLQDVNAPSPSAQKLTDIWEVKREKGGRKYKIVTREYMATGHDGFEALKGMPYLVDDESGQVMSALVRKYLLSKNPFLELSLKNVWTEIWVTGARFVNSLTRAGSFGELDLLNEDSKTLIHREKNRQDRYAKSAASKWRAAAGRAVRWSRAHYRDHFKVAATEHMSAVDCIDGDKMRKLHHEDEDSADEDESEDGDDKDDTLVLIHPVVDGRLRDEGRS